MPQLLDPNFKRSVVLLVHHDEEGTFGLVVNRDTDLPVSQLCETLEIAWRGLDDELLSWGGPVQPNTGWVLFDDAGEDVEDASAVVPGLQVAGTLEALRSVAEAPPEHVRLLVGYAGWGPGQLEGELAQGAWLLAPAEARVVFDVDHEGMWEHVVRSLGIDPSTLVSTPGVH